MKENISLLPYPLGGIIGGLPSALCLEGRSPLKRLDELQSVLIYLPITTDVILLAAQFWASARKAGKSTADPKSLDGDVILAAQAKIQESNGYQVIVATTNVKHLSLFIDAREWHDIE